MKIFLKYPNVFGLRVLFIYELFKLSQNINSTRIDPTWAGGRCVFRDSKHGGTYGAGANAGLDF